MQRDEVTADVVLDQVALNIDRLFGDVDQADACSECVVTGIEPVDARIRGLALQPRGHCPAQCRRDRVQNLPALDTFGQLEEALILRRQATADQCREHSHAKSAAGSLMSCASFN